jgi:hypothetical protein
VGCIRAAVQHVPFQRSRLTSRECTVPERPLRSARVTRPTMTTLAPRARHALMARCARGDRRSRREDRRDGAFALAARPSFVHETPQARIVALRISRSPGLAL